MSYTIGIDLGGTLTKLALVSEGGVIVAQRKLATVAGRDPRAALAELQAPIEALAAASGLAGSRRACGIGIPGALDFRSGFLMLSGPLGWKNVPLAEIARTTFGCPVAVDTDANAGALADLHFGCARDASDVLYVSWGTGIGAGLVFSRRLYHSRGGAMCNLGHVPADPSSARRCYCGSTGCLEVEAGGRALVAQIAERLDAGENSSLSFGPSITPERIAGAAASGDRLAASVLQRAATLMARVLAGVLALLNPDTVVFGGGVSRCFPLIREAFDRELKARTPHFILNLTSIRESAFGDAAGALGASALPMHSEGYTT